MKPVKEIYILVLILFLPFNGVFGNKLIMERGINPNHSAEYVRTVNRSASTDADAAFYNPAGLAYIGETGLYVMFSSQTYYVKKTHTMDYYAIQVGENESSEMTYHTKDDFKGYLPDEYFTETVAPILPDLDIVYRGKTGGHEWAAYFDFSITQAAPGMVFPKGIAIIDWGNLAEQETVLSQSAQVFTNYNADAVAKRTEFLISGTLGGAYQVLDWFSVALGGRYINARGNMNIQVENLSYTVDGTTTFGTDWDIDVDYKGHGASVIAGCHFQFEKGSGTVPRWVKPFDIGFKVEYHTPIVMTKTTNSLKAPGTIEASGSLDIFKDGTEGKDMTYADGNGDSTFTFQYPIQFNLGIAYKIYKNLKVEWSGEITLRQLRDLDGREDDYKPIGYRVGACVEWGFLKHAKASLGYLYSDYGIKDNKRDEADFLMPSHTIGTGMSIKLTERCDFTVGFFYEIYVSQSIYAVEYTYVSEATYHYIHKEFNESRFSLALGVTYRFFGDDADESEDDKKVSGLKKNRLQL